MATSRRRQQDAAVSDNIVLDNVLESFKGALVFKEGTGGDTKYLVFFPGNKRFRDSKDQREAAKNRLTTMNDHADSLGVYPVTMDNAHFQMHDGQRGSRTAYCLKFNDTFDAVLSKLDRECLALPVVECETFASPDIVATIEKFYLASRHDTLNKFVMPVHLNGVLHAEADDRIEALAPLEKQRTRFRRMAPTPAAKPQKAAEVVETVDHKPDSSRLPFMEYMEYEKLHGKKQPRTEQQVVFAKGFIAHPEDSELSLFVPKDPKLPPDVVKDMLQFALGVEDADLADLKDKPPAQPRYPTVRGMLQFPLKDDKHGTVAEKIESLVENLGVDVFNEGKPAPYLKVSEYKSRRMQDFAAEGSAKGKQ